MTGFRSVLLPPGMHGDQDRLERAAQRCEAVFDTWRDLAEIPAHDQTIGFHLLELL